uniref:Uncharacterized protein n=1 Tax=Picea glauca TaxID=3330 RepID=A0A124GMA9_PICGL|nr:hypothetical protein ABT39_MTgene4061 [Picea glauca]
MNESEVVRVISRSGLSCIFTSASSFDPVVDRVVEAVDPVGRAGGSIIWYGCKLPGDDSPE